MARPFMTVGPTVDADGAPNVEGLPLASLARLFHLAAIRPDKSRGSRRNGASTLRRIDDADCVVNKGFL